MADAVLGVVLEKLLTFIQDESHHAFEFSNHLKKMKKELLFVQGYLKDVDKVKMKDRKEILKVSLGELREFLYDAEDSIAECELMLPKEQRNRASNCMMCCSISTLIFHYQMGKRLSQINQDIGSIREKMTSYLGTAPNQERIIEGNQPLRYPVLINEDELVGLNDDLSKIMEWVLQKDKPFKVIGIVGMGGIGKTTLAQKIYNNDIVKVHFDHILIVVISQSFELKEIIKDILRKLDIKEDLFMRDEIGLLQQLHDQLKGNYLLILDDIWNIDEGGSSWWESLKSGLPRRNGSCVIVTTRIEEVARSLGAIENHIHHLQLLSDEDSWPLFCKIAFAMNGGQCLNRELERIGKEIVSQCNRLPLAIKVVGGMMLGKGLSLFEWKQVSGRLKEELVVCKKDELVLSTLKLSYEDAPMNLKPCMLSLAVFPEDYEIYMNDIIYWWIGEGFVRGRDEKTAYEIGEEWWAELINRGLLLPLRKDSFEKVIIYCRVHDMVREMIIGIAKEENFMSWDVKGSPSLDIKSRRAAQMKATTDDFFVSKLIPKSMLLRTLIWKNIEGREFNSKLYQLKWLRVLLLKFTNYDVPVEKDDWCSGIGSLPHLVYLKIRNSRMERLPDSIGNLQNLQVLFLMFCRKLKTLPAQVTSLQKLTHFRITTCNSLEYYPVWIGNLSNLEELNEIKPACSRIGDGFRVSDLQKLTKLRRLGMKIDSEDRIGDKELKVLSQLKQLKYLVIWFRGRSKNDEEPKWKVNYDISPCHQLQKLYLYDFPGDETPAWLNPTTLPNLRFLNIHGGKMRRMHPGFFGNSDNENRGVWGLEALRLVCLYELEEEWPRMHVAMPYFRVLKVSKCPKLKLLPCDMDEHGEGIWRK